MDAAEFTVTEPLVDLTESASSLSELTILFDASLIDELPAFSVLNVTENEVDYVDSNRIVPPPPAL